MSSVKERVKNFRCVRKAYYCYCGIVRKKQLHSKAHEALQKFGVTCADEHGQQVLINDMVSMYTKWGYSFDEYLYYHFENKSLEERMSFVADWEHLGYACKLNNHANDSLFDNKILTYEKYKKYYKREVLHCNGSNIDQFKAFVERNPDFVIKPLAMSCGKGVSVFRKGDYANATALYADLLSRDEFIAEALIRQVPEMAKLHPQSVNTLRVTTIRMNNEVRLIHPVMRIGQKGSCVDNGGAGGIFCALDEETGKIVAAADEHGGRFEIHPDTGEQIVGFCVPNWAQVRGLVCELAQIMPDNRYTGWDLALTPEGWLLVEANRRAQFVAWQLPTELGFRDEINGILSELGLNY